MTTLTSMPPVVDHRSRIIILGSMPGRESLEKQQYYAKKQNSFWRIVHALFDAVPEDGYDARLAFVLGKDIALWDVLHECERTGSSDSSITNEAANDLGSFFRAHPGMGHVFFNGKKAARSFEKGVRLPPDVRERLRFTTLPSTSPANAGMRFDSKLAAWMAVREALDDERGPQSCGRGGEGFEHSSLRSTRLVR